MLAILTHKFETMRILLFIILLFNVSFPCQHIYKPVNKFNPDESIFTGKVLKYVFLTKYFEIKQKSIPYNYWGILVEVKDRIYIPGDSSNFYEIYPFDLSSDCSLINFGENTLKTLFPLGSIARIVATPPEVLEKIPSRFPVLEISPRNNFRMSVNIDSISFLNSTKNSVYNYPVSKDKELTNFIAYLTDSLKINEKSKMIFDNSVYSLQDFELRKDFWRLHFMKNDTLKIPVIERLKNFEYFGSGTLIRIINENIINPQIRGIVLSKLFTINRELPLNSIILQKGK